jgi:hypothetical protein
LTWFWRCGLAGSLMPGTEYRTQIGSLGHSLHCELCAKALDAIAEEVE